MENTLFEIVKGQFQLDLYGDHGISHWERVEKIGLYLSKVTNADTKVIKLFALLHDSKRESEGKDPEHGARAARFVQQLYEENKLQITRIQYRVLFAACKKHSQPYARSNSITVQTCWDSDRLDLWRIGIKPDPRYLYTDYAKNYENLSLALRL